MYALHNMFFLAPFGLGVGLVFFALLIGVNSLDMRARVPPCEPLFRRGSAIKCIVLGAFFISAPILAYNYTVSTILDGIDTSKHVISTGVGSGPYYSDYDLADQVRWHLWYSQREPISISPTIASPGCSLFGDDGVTDARINMEHAIWSGFDFRVVGRAQLPDRRWLVEGNLDAKNEGCEHVRALVDIYSLVSLVLVSRKLPALAQPEVLASQEHDKLMAHDARAQAQASRMQHNQAEAASVETTR